MLLLLLVVVLLLLLAGRRLLDELGRLLADCRRWRRAARFALDRRRLLAPLLASFFLVFFRRAIGVFGAMSLFKMLLLLLLALLVVIVCLRCGLLLCNAVVV